MAAIEKKGQGELVEKSFIHYLPVVIVGILICGVPSAILNSCAGIFMTPMAEDFGVPMTQIALWRTLDYITGIIITPFAGVWLAKYNVKWILLAAAIVESLVFVLFGSATQVWMLWVGGAIVGISNSIMLGVSVAAIMNRWFRANVGIIIGVCTAFTGFGGMIFTPIGQAIIESSGWRASYITLGIISLVVMTLAILFLLTNRPEDKGLLPYGTAKAAEKAKIEKTEAALPPSVRPSVARKSIILWLFILLGLMINSIANVNAYFATYITWFNSQDAVTAGIIAGAFVTGAEITAYNSFGNAAGKLGLGLFSDVNPLGALVAMVVCGAAGLFFMWQFPTTVLLPIGGVLMGIFIPGTLVVMPMLVRRCFGNGASYPIIWSYVGMSLAAGGAVGSYFWAAIYDATAAFGGVFITALVMMAIVLVLGIVVYSMRDKLPREDLKEEEL